MLQLLQNKSVSQERQPYKTVNKSKQPEMKKIALQDSSQYFRSLVNVRKLLILVNSKDYKSSSVELLPSSCFLTKIFPGFCQCVLADVDMLALCFVMQLE